jgi:hypothetical protein
MRYAILLAILLCSLSGGEALAQKKVFKGTITTPQTVTTPYTGVVNKGTISVDTGTALTVTGTAARKVINKGTLSGQIGLSVTGSSSSVVINNGTIRGVSSGISVGVQQLP